MGGVIKCKSVNIGRGCRICVAEGGVLTLGDKFSITGDTTIICSKGITFGDDCLLSWDILLMDTDFHSISNEQNEIVNSSRPISFGDHVWVGCRSIILKGSEIPSGCVIAAGSLLSGSKLTRHNSVYSANGSNVSTIKENIFWNHYIAVH